MSIHGNFKVNILRRNFLKTSGFLLGILGIGSSCKNEETVPEPKRPLEFSNDDNGILNYLLVLQQLNALYYSLVLTSPGFSVIFTKNEQEVFAKINGHNIVHKEFINYIITNDLSQNPFLTLEIDFSSINFNERGTVLNNAVYFEDLNIAAFNGILNAINNKQIAISMLKIVSVKSRHSTVLRDIILPFSDYFASDGIVSKDDGLDSSLLPNDIISKISPYFKVTLSGNNLPVY